MENLSGIIPVCTCILPTICNNGGIERRGVAKRNPGPWKARNWRRMMAIKIINADGSATRTSRVEAANAETHIAARDHLASEAKILQWYDADESLADRDPIAWKWADPTEDGRFVFDEEDVDAIEREDPSLIERIEVSWE